MKLLYGKSCTWVKSPSTHQYVTECCNSIRTKGRKWIYCPYCGSVINIIKSRNNINYLK